MLLHETEASKYCNKIYYCHLWQLREFLFQPFHSYHGFPCTKKYDSKRSKLMFSYRKQHTFFWFFYQIGPLQVYCHSTHNQLTIRMTIDSHWLWIDWKSNVNRLTIDCESIHKQLSIDLQLVANRLTNNCQSINNQLTNRMTIDSHWLWINWKLIANRMSIDCKSIHNYL